MSKKEELKNEIIKIVDTGKSKIIKKYNLSLNSIHTLMDLLNNSYNEFLQKNVAECLIDYQYEVVNYGIGYKLIN